MPKAELHLHLDGSLRVETALALARSRGVEAPQTYAAMFEALVAPRACPSQAVLLERFDLPIALLQDAEALEQVTAELVEAKAADNVRYVEIRWGPALHTRRGLSLSDGIDAVCRGARVAADRTGTTVRLICTALRSHDPEDVARAGPDGRPLPGPRADRLGPGRSRGCLSRSTRVRAGLRDRPGRAGCGSPSMPANGAARPRSGGRWPSIPSGSPTARARSTTPT